MSKPHLLHHRRGDIAWLTLSRPEALNALTWQFIEELNVALQTFEEGEPPRCVVLTGAGRAFCAGADLKFIGEMPAEQRDAATLDFLRAASGVMSRLEKLPIPVIAAVNGIATAGGMELVLCCDLVVASAEARFGDGHANYGLLPGGGASVRLPRRIGLNRANYLFFTGALQSAATLQAAGLVNEIVPGDQLESAASSLAETIAAKSPIGLRVMKALASNAWDRPLQEALDSELEANRAYALTHDRNEGLAAFAEGRAPQFIGR